MSDPAYGRLLAAMEQLFAESNKLVEKHNSLAVHAVHMTTLTGDLNAVRENLKQSSAKKLKQ